MAEFSSDDIEKKIRRLRKKLLQIEHLEILSRELNAEELAKIEKKQCIREQLRAFIKEIEMKRGVSNENGDRSAKVPKLNEPTAKVKSSSSSAEAAADISSPSSSCSSSTSCSANSTAPPTPSHQPVSTSPQTSSSTTTKVSRGGARNLRWTVEELDGHEDLIVDCHISLPDEIAVTASRDTSIKVWNLSTGSLLHSLRGHHGSVNGVRIMRWRTEVEPSQDDGEDSSSQLSDGQLVCVSASSDCSLKIWNLETGVEARSIYTFNGINKLEIIRDQQLSVSGTDGGKLEVYLLAEARSLASLTAHQDAVTALSILESDERTLLASGSSDGLIKVFEVGDSGAQLRCLYVSENLSSSSGSPAFAPRHTVRPVRCVLLDASEAVYYGDDGHNLKLLDWKNNSLVKFRNHAGDHGFTDHVAQLTSAAVGSHVAAERFILATSYDIDSGQGLVNLYSATAAENDKKAAGAAACRQGKPRYVATLEDPAGTSRICVMSCAAEKDFIVIMTAGRQLKVWKSCSTGQNHVSTSIKGCILRVGESQLVDSASGESDSDEEEDSADPLSPGLQTNKEPDMSKPGSGFCNCSVM